MEFEDVRKTRTKKKKMMLWIDRDLIERLDELKPPRITTQEAIRQVIKSFVEDSESMGGL